MKPEKYFHLYSIIEFSSHNCNNNFTFQMSTVQSIAPIISSALFTFIFKETITAFPGACFYVQGALALPAICVNIWIAKFTILPNEVKKNNEQTREESSGIKKDNEQTREEIPSYNL